MKKIITFLFALSLLYSNICYSQSGWLQYDSDQKHSVNFAIDTSAHRYFPLNVGNCYVFRKERTNFPTVNVVFYISSSFVVNGHRYYKCLGDPVSGYWRYDSLSGNLNRYDSVQNIECRADSLWSSYDNIMGTCFAPGGVTAIKCTADGSPVTVLGYSTIEKGFTSSNQPPPYHVRKYAKNIGLHYYYNYQSLIAEYTYTLLACVVNGIKYGDTTLLNTKIQSVEILSTPFLTQNYPNPFNPVTKIKYDIPLSKGARGMIVQLIIYDILGREIETLVNETQRPGSYEVTWDGSRYASGVYFYRLITDEYVETKKMVLIK